MMNIQKIPNQIIKQPLQYLNLAKVDSIALHHMAHPTADVKTVESWHINQGWRAIGYNFWVGFDGTVYEGRGFKLGAGVENENGHISLNLPQPLLESHSVSLNLRFIICKVD